MFEIDKIGGFNTLSKEEGTIFFSDIGPKIQNLFFESQMFSYKQDSPVIVFIHVCGLLV